jgi:hypothetical protein
MGLLDEAVHLDREVLATRKRVLGADHPETLASANNLANTLRVQGHLDEAEELLRTTLATKHRVLGHDHPESLVTASNLARTLYSKGHFRAAATMDQTVLEVRRRVLGPRHPRTLSSARSLAQNLYALGFLGKDRDEPVCITSAISNDCGAECMALGTYSTVDLPQSKEANDSKLFTIELDDGNIEEGVPMTKLYIDPCTTTLEWNETMLALINSLHGLRGLAMQR